VSAPTVFEGHLDARGKSFALVVGRFNEFIVGQLEKGALDTIARHGGDLNAVKIYRVPGAWELPMVVGKVAALGGVDAIIALGAVIRGSTPHFDFVANEASKGIANMSLKHGVPVAMGILTTDTIEQAIERAGTKAGNKGGEAALAAVEMADLYARMGAST
jgi:6,7-dimethyl-8-ribityllumazine synthase